MSSSTMQGAVLAYTREGTRPSTSASVRVDREREQDGIRPSSASDVRRLTRRTSRSDGASAPAPGEMTATSRETYTSRTAAEKRGSSGMETTRLPSAATASAALVQDRAMSSTGRSTRATYPSASSNRVNNNHLAPALPPTALHPPDSLSAVGALPHQIPNGHPMQSSSSSSSSVSPFAMDFADPSIPRAELLARWRSRRGATATPTAALLRDMLYLLQGIDGSHVKFTHKTQSQKNWEANPYLVEPDFGSWGTSRASKSTSAKGKQKEIIGRNPGGPLDGLEDDITGLTFEDEHHRPYPIPRPLQTTMVELAELGMLYKRVFGFVREEGGDMAGQSLRHVLQTELQKYHSLLSTLEREMAKDDAHAPDLDDSNNSELLFGQVPEQASRMTFAKLSLWAQEVVLKMRMMSVLVEEARSTKGGALLSAIHAHISHGDPVVQEFAEHILDEVSKPFFATLSRWIFTGELHDPHSEFFVQRNPSHHQSQHDPEHVAYMLWEKQYVFVKTMLPSFVGEELARKIFSTGKSINFIRYSCRDSEWETVRTQLASVETVLDIPKVERTIDKAYNIASARLLEIFFDQCRLLDHLNAMRRYILLQEADFADTLLGSVGPRLDRDASKLLRHHLTHDIETAIGNSSAKHESFDVLRRLDARIFDPTPGDLGWDVFALEYKVEAPINAVLDGKAMVEYDKVFSWLWRARRVGRTLRSGWMSTTFALRQFKRLRGFGHLFHRAQILQTAMIHFLGQLEAFSNLEGIELAWEEFLTFAHDRKGDLDALIGAHRRYLAKIVGVVMYGEDAVMGSVNDALDIVMEFAAISDSLYRLALAEALRMDRQRDVERGIIVTAPMEDRSSEKFALEQRLLHCTDRFKAQMTDLIAGLETHKNYDVRFLAIRLGWNEFYNTKKRPKSSKSRLEQTRAE